jgi:hypothetical protein
MVPERQDNKVRCREWATVITFASIEESKRELKMIADYGMASVKRAWNKSVHHCGIPPGR